MSVADPLDELDHRILLELIAEPLAPFAQIAERLGATTATVAGRYRRMQRRGLVRISGRTLPGFGGRHVFLVRAWALPAQTARLAAHIAAYDHSRWVRVSTDGAELMCGLVTDTPHTDPVLTRVPAEPGVREVRVCELLDVWGAHGDLTTHAAIRMDGLDERLLAALALDGRARLRALAARLGVDPSTVSRRRQRLVDAGVLYFEADVHPGALGGTGDAMVWMTVPPGRIRATGRALRADRRIRFVAATGGRHDLVVHVHVIDHRALLAFLDETLAELSVTATEVVPMGRVFKRNAV